MTGRLVAVVAGGAAVDVVAGSSVTWPTAVQQAAATVTALTVLLGALWWLVGPRVRAYVRAQTNAARKVDQVADTQLPAATAATSDVADQLAALRGDLAELRLQLHDHLVMASGETRLVSELLMRAREDEFDHHHHREGQS